VSAAPIGAGIARPRAILAAVGHTYPALWSAVDQLRALRASAFPHWPDWCFLPLQASYAILSGGGDRRIPIERIHRVGIVSALATWRVTQGVYRFDPTVAAAVAATPLAGELPTDLLYRLPEWCVFIETPGRTWEGRTLHGFWAHLEWEDGGGADELRLVLDTAETPALALDPRRGLVPVPLILGDGALADALARVAESGRRRLAEQGLSDQDAHRPDPAQRLAAIQPLVALVLYLCAENAELGDGTRRPGLPKPTRTKRGPRLFPPDQPTTWEVGMRLGAALRQAATAAEPAPGAVPGERTRPRAHIRRAHWHTFRVGEGRQGHRVKWMAPVAVNVPDPAALAVTVRPVG
jgi:hypothetical protein